MGSKNVVNRTVSCELEEFVIALQSYQVNHNWISVKDRLPQTDKGKICVLVACNYKGKQIVKTANGVTHWQYLPELPKKEW